MKEQEPNRTEQLRLFIVGEILSGRGQAPPLRSLYTPLSRGGGPCGRPGFP